MANNMGYSFSEQECCSKSNVRTVRVIVNLLVLFYRAIFEAFYNVVAQLKTVGQTLDVLFYHFNLPMGCCFLYYLPRIYSSFIIIVQ